MIDARIKNLRFVVISLLLLSAFATFTLREFNAQRTVADDLFPFALVRTLLDSGEIDRLLSRTAKNAELGDQDKRFSIPTSFRTTTGTIPDLVFPIDIERTSAIIQPPLGCKLPVSEFGKPPLFGNNIEIVLKPYGLPTTEPPVTPNEIKILTPVTKEKAVELGLPQKSFGLTISNRIAWQASCHSGELKRIYRISTFGAATSRPIERFDYHDGVSYAERRALGPLLRQLGAVNSTALEAYATLASRLDRNKARLPVLGLDLKFGELTLAIAVLIALLSMWGGHLMRQLAVVSMTNREEPWLLFDTLTAAITNDPRSHIVRGINVLETLVVHSGHIVAMVTPAWLFWLYLNTDGLNASTTVSLFISAVFSLTMFGAYFNLTLKVVRDAKLGKPAN